MTLEGVKLTLFLIFVFGGSWAANFKPKIFTVEKFMVCPNSESMPFDIIDLDIRTPSQNKFLVTGRIVIRENVTGNLLLNVDVTRCNLDMSHCEKYDRLHIPKICDKINDKTTLWSPMTKMIKPRMRCPITVGEHMINNGTFDLNMIARMPIDGYRWLVTNRVWIGEKKKLERMVFCLEGDVSITTKRKS